MHPQESLRRDRRCRPSHTCIISSSCVWTSTSGKDCSSQKGGSCSLSGLGVVAYAASPSLGPTPNSYKLMYTFVHCLYDPGHFADPSYIAMVPDLQTKVVIYAIRISEGGSSLSRFLPHTRPNPFASRTHALFEFTKVDGKVFTVLKDQLPT